MTTTADEIAGGAAWAMMGKRKDIYIALPIANSMPIAQSLPGRQPCPFGTTSSYG